MTTPVFPTHHRAMHTRMQAVHSPHEQRGVVLIIALILLVVISLLAVTSMRNVSSSESVASNVRTSELATQSAEIALRYCEDSVQQVVKAAVCGTPTFTTTFTAANILTASNPAHWQNVATWDSTSTATYVLPLSQVNQAGMTTTTYKRPPECMVEPLPMVVAGTSAVSTTAAFVITARGFGPEVARADSSRTRPAGTEVWVQSHIELDPDSCFTPPPGASPPPTPVTEEEIKKDEEDKQKNEDKKNEDKKKKENKKKEKKR